MMLNPDEQHTIYKHPTAIAAKHAHTSLSFQDICSSTPGHFSRQWYVALADADQHGFWSSSLPVVCESAIQEPVSHRLLMHHPIVEGEHAVKMIKDVLGAGSLSDHSVKLRCHKCLECDSRAFPDLLSCIPVAFPYSYSFQLLTLAKSQHQLLCAFSFTRSQKRCGCAGMRKPNACRVLRKSSFSSLVCSW